jgi:formate C-acetyltransferase
MNVLYDLEEKEKKMFRQVLNIPCEAGSAEKYKKSVKNVKPEVCIQRAILVTESYRNTEAMAPVLRRAMALKHILENMDIFIDENEVIVGNLASKVMAAPIFPEYAIKWFKDEMDTIPNRPMDSFIINKNIMQQMDQVFDYWNERTFSEKCIASLPQYMLDADKIKAIYGEHLTNEGDGHLIVDYQKVLRIGLTGIAKEAAQRLDSLEIYNDSSVSARYFLMSVMTVCNAVTCFAKRFASLARTLSEKVQETARKEVLRDIAAICERVPGEPARSFSEALQSLWFIHLVLQIESNGHSISLGRFDQYLYPYFNTDLQNNRLTEDQALELIKHFWIKLNTINKIRPWSDTEFLTGYPMFQNVTIGGQKTFGKDAVNKLTYLCLKATEEVAMPQPSLSARYYAGSSQEYLRACVLCIKKGLGMPAMFNDDAIIPALLNRGVTYEDAENYGMVGCVEVAVPGKWGYRCNGMSYFNMLKVLELALNNGVDPETQICLVPGTGSMDTFSSMDDLWKAWNTQLEWFTNCYVQHDAIVDTILEQLLPDPFCSALVDDCIARGKTIKQGGAVYDIVSAQSIGIANISNAIASVKRLCFDEDLVAPARYKQAMDSNFDNEDGKKLLEFIKAVPKYGNDDDDVDGIAVKIMTEYAQILRRYKNARLNRGPINCGWQISTSTVTANVPFGKSIGATPDGRKKEESLAEGCSPVQGSDISGPTASMNTITKLPNVLIAGGQLYNMKFSPQLLSEEKGIEAMITLLRGYGARKGWHVQFNIVNAQTLIEAQKRPENYRDLVVRVAGYSAYFVDLNNTIQNDIIKRTEHLAN